jgi:hypothetical protein
MKSPNPDGLSPQKPIENYEALICSFGKSYGFSSRAKGKPQQRKGGEFESTAEGKIRSGEKIEAATQRPFSGIGSKTNPNPSSIGLTFGKRALCPQGPEGSNCFLKKTMQAVGRFVEKVRGGPKRKKKTRTAGICRKFFNRAMSVLLPQFLGHRVSPCHL